MKSTGFPQAVNRSLDAAAGSGGGDVVPGMGRLKQWWRRLTHREPVRVYLVGGAREPMQIWATRRTLRQLRLTDDTFAILVQQCGVRALCPTCQARSGDWDARFEDGPGR